MANKGSTELPKFPQQINGKNYEKIFLLQSDFRVNIEYARQSISEIMYLYQEDLDSNDNKFLEDIVLCFDGIINELIENYIPSSKKLNIIKRFYKEKTEELENAKKKFFDKFYPDAKNIFDNFPIESHKKRLFQGFVKIKHDEDVEKIEAIEPPNNYNLSLNDDTCNNYDKFVAIINTIIYLRKIIDFNKEFEIRRNELKAKEKETNEKAADEIFQKYLDACKELKKVKKELKVSKEKCSKLEDENIELKEEIDKKDSNETDDKNDEEIARLQKEIKRKDKEISVLKKKNKELEEECNDLYNKKEKVSDNSKLESDKLQADIDDLRAKLFAKDDEIKDKIEHINTLKGYIEKNAQKNPSNNNCNIF